MTEALYDLLYIIDNIITDILKIGIIIVIYKLIRNKNSCLRRLKDGK